MRLRDTPLTVSWKGAAGKVREGEGAKGE